MNKLIHALILLALSLFLLQTVAAKDVAYVLKSAGSQSPAVISILNNLNYSYDIINDSQILTTNFSNYAVLLTQGDLNNKLFLPFSTKSTIAIVDDSGKNVVSLVWGNANVGRMTASGILSVSLDLSQTPFVIGFPSNASSFQPYTASSSHNLYSINRGSSSPAIIRVISYNADSNVAYSTILNYRDVFFGLSDTNSWTSNTNLLFTNSLRWVRGDSPTLTSNIPDINFDENTNYSLNLSNYFKDPQGSPLSYGVYDTSHSSNITLTWNSGLVTLQSSKNWYGNAWIVFYATNLKSNANNALTNVIQLNVNHVNQPPVLQQINNITLNEEQEITINANATDPESDNLIYSINNSNFNQNENNFTWTPQYGDAGLYYVNISVTDGELSDSQIVKIIVNKVNLAPVIEDIGNQTTQENTPLSFTIDASSPDKGTLTYSAYGTNVQCSANNSNITIIPALNFYGDASCTITVTEGVLNTTKVVPISIVQVNSPPILIENISDINLNEPNSIEINLSQYFTDPESDNLTYDIYSQSNNLQITLNDSIATLSSDQFFDSTSFVIFSASDGISSTQSNNVTVSIIHSNHPPAMENIADLKILEGQTAELQINAADVDGDSLDYSINDSRFTQDNNTFTWLTRPGDTGTYYFNLSVSDGDLSDSKTVKVEVLPKIVINEINANEHWLELYSTDTVDLTGCYIQDSRPNILTFDRSITNNFLAVDWHLINNSNILSLYCFGTLMDSVNYTIPGGNISLSRIPDGYDTNSSSDFVLTNATKGFSNTADTIPPTISLISPENNSVLNDSSVTLAYSASDDQAQEMNCSLTLNSTQYNNTVINNQEQEVALENLSNDQYSWSVSCSDSRNTATSETLQFTINKKLPLTMDNINDTSVYENQSVILAINVSNSNGNVIYSINDSRFTQDNNTFTWQTNYSDSGEYYFTVSASDDISEASQIVHITVIDAILLPVMQDITPINVLENSNTTPIQLNATDPEGNLITFSVANQDTNKANCTINGSLLSITPAQNFFGNTTCTIRAYNVKNQYTEKISSINVGWVNSPPVITSFSPRNNIKLLENTSQRFSVTAHDPDGGLVYYWLLQNQRVGSSSTYYFTQPKGSYQLKAIATDGQYNVSQTWNVVVGSYTDFTCSDLNGQVCDSSQICSDSTVNSSDSGVCCLSSCSDRPPAFTRISQCTNTTGNVDVSFSYPSSEDTISLGSNMSVSFYINNNLNESKTFRSNVYLYDITKDKIISDKSSSVKVGSSSEENAQAQFTIDNGLNEGDSYALFIKAKSGNYCAQNYEKIALQRKDHDLSIEKVNIPQDILCGDSINVSVSLNNSGSNEEQTTLSIENSELNIQASTNKFYIYKGDSVEKSLNINIPGSASNDTYILNIVAYSDAARTTSTQTITLGECKQIQVNMTTSPITLTPPINSNSQEKISSLAIVSGIILVFVIIILLFWLFL